MKIQFKAVNAFTYEDLIKWSKDIPQWQRDALRRLLSQNSLSPKDLDELVELAKAPYSTEVEGQPQASPADLDHIKTSSEHFPVVRLATVRNIRYVNALGEGPVPFGDNDFALIYGGNASGKSGIARILKRSCRARDPGGDVLSNVFEPPTTQPAAATIDFRVDDEEVSYDWIDGGVPCPDLLSVNTFDSRCAAIQVEKSNLVLYTPELLRVFKSLALIVDEVANRLRTLKALLGTRPLFLEELRLNPGTSTEQFLAALNADSDLARLETTHVARVDNQNRLNELERALADDPLRRSQSEEAREARIARLNSLATEIVDLLTDQGSEEFEALLTKRADIRQALRASRESFSKTSDLDGLGTDTWRSLWEAARKYSETHAYEGEPFPVLREGAVCVLCQQPLNQNATNRLHTFEEFVQADLQQQADKIEEELEAGVERLTSISLPTSIRVAIRDAQLLGTPSASQIKRFLIGLKLRRRYLLGLAAGRAVGKRPSLVQPPSLGPLLDLVRAEIANLKLAMRAEARLSLEKERSDLRDRKTITPHIRSVRKEIVRLGNLRTLDLALTDCKTQAITLKARQAETLILTNALRTNFAEYLTAMGFAGMPVKISIGAGDHGQHPYDMKLIPRPGVPPVEVLSEGEKTCVALAGFLGELHTTGNRSAIVLDDPVSSLDHNYRKRVAEVLIREAKTRQVIVLTHDIVFFYLIRKYAAELSVSISEVSLQRGYERNFGHANLGPPWVAMTIKQRLHQLRSELVGARRLLNNGDRTGYERSAELIYKRLRQSWERAVEEVLLNQTVLRFGDAVQTQRLTKLTDISDSDVETVTKEMSRCSDFVHDEAGAVHGDLPEPGIIETDIARLDLWVTELRKQRGR